MQISSYLSDYLVLNELNGHKCDFPILFTSSDDTMTLVKFEIMTTKMPLDTVLSWMEISKVNIILCNGSFGQCTSTRESCVKITQLYF
jgi:hypothetical protein